MGVPHEEDRVTLEQLTQLVRTAHGDAWEVEGRLRVPHGGGAARVRGARLMASGIAQPRWNNADVTSEGVDLEAIGAWYAARDLPWGMRVPLDLVVDLGTPLFVKRCVGLLPETFPRQAASGGAIHVRPAGVAAAAAHADLDLAVFGGEVGESRAWVGPQIGARSHRLWVAEMDGVPVGLATTVRSDGDAGPAAYLTGFGAVPGAPRAEVIRALVWIAVADAFDSGATLVHANPDDDEEAGLLAGHGATEVPGFLVRVVRAT
jgi:hypothetical protein